MNSEPGAGEERSGGLSLWERVGRDPKFAAAKRDIRNRYGLPLPYDIRWNFGKWQKWLGLEDRAHGQRRKRGDAFLNDVHALLKKFQVPESWYPDFIADIAGTTSDHRSDLNIPKFNFYQSVEGEWKWECIITPETDLTNPFILDLIQKQQKEYAGAPPKPGRSGADHRKLDWRPLYEWHKRHPLFSIAEISGMIGFSSGTVQRRFREIAKGGTR